MEIELWGSQKRTPFEDLSELQFETFASPKHVPILALQGPCMRLCVPGAKAPGSGGHTNETVAKNTRYWAELAASEVAIVAKLGQSNGSRVPKRSFDHVLIFASQESENAAILVRPFDLNFRETLERQFAKQAAGARPTDSFYSNSSTPILSSANSPQVVERHDTIKDAASDRVDALGLTLLPQPEPISHRRPNAAAATVDRSAKAAPALHQVIWSALRLRGYERDQADCKQMYQLCCRAAEVAFRQRSGPLSLEVMQEKVDAILNVLEL